MIVQQFFVEGLGCASYLVGCEGAGMAAVIDPDREVQKYLDTATAKGLKITHIIETHMHADHVSGNTELADRTGAEIYVHAASEATFAHKALAEGDALEIGNIRLTVLHTPGHTPESITLLISDLTRGQDPWVALTGDTLFVGDVGRPDLVGMEAARDLAGDMYETINAKLLKQPDGLLIYPGHGAGSLCGKSIGAMRSTTLGYERSTNPALAQRAKDDFIQWDVENLPEQPANVRRIKGMNRRGPVVLGEIKPKALTVHDSLPYFQRGAALLDTRSKEAYVAKHVPGSVHLPADEQLSNRIGFILPPEVPVVLLLSDPAEYSSVVYSLARVGYEHVVGYLAASLEEWEAMGLPVTSGDIRDIEARELKALLDTGNGDRPVVVDVREAWEFRSGHVEDSVHIPLGELAQRVSELDPERPVAVICASGSRSQSAAAFLGQRSFKTVYNIVGGTSSWMRAGLPLSRN
ncbi:MAG TPA: rhodanese-like domain-containing protein [Anaerolineales bacterium]|nr:rhodanese-like domain-containing protein [Anaerolineales bacterium]